MTDPAVDFPFGFEWSAEDERPVATRYSARDVAESLGVAERTVRRWIKSGRLPAEKNGGSFLIAMDDAREVFASTRAAGRASNHQYVEWLERENERLWRIVERAAVGA